MKMLNKQAYTMERDRLIYDGSHEIDGSAVVITTESSGEIRRGALLDYSDGTYVLHAANGTPSAIAAETVEYTETDIQVTVPVYISGTFRKAAVISPAALTAADVETLRSKGIYLK